MSTSMASDDLYPCCTFVLWDHMNFGTVVWESQYFSPWWLSTRILRSQTIHLLPPVVVRRVHVTLKQAPLLAPHSFTSIAWTRDVTTEYDVWHPYPTVEDMRVMSASLMATTPPQQKMKCINSMSSQRGSISRPLVQTCKTKHIVPPSLGRLHNCASVKCVCCSYSLHILDFLDISIMFPMFLTHIYLYTST